MSKFKPNTCCSVCDGVGSFEDLVTNPYTGDQRPLTVRCEICGGTGLNARKVFNGPRTEQHQTNWKNPYA